MLTFYSTGTPSGGNGSLSLLANFNIASADIGRTGSYYIAALLPTGQLFLLTPSGFIQYTGGPIPTYSTGTLSNRSMTVLSGVNVTPFLGAILFAGYGLNDADLIGNSKYNAIYTVQSTGTPSGGNSSLSLLANFNIASADVGRTGNFYIAALLPTGQLFFLTPSGFMQYAGGPLPTYSTDTLSNRSITVLSGFNITPFVGTTFFAGYGLNDADLIGNSKYSAIYTVQ